MKSYTKDFYDTNLGYSLHHTRGISAEESTVRYLHYPSEFMFYYFVKGSGIANVESKHYEIGEGDIIMLFPSEAGCCVIDENVFHERIVLHVNESILKNFPINTKSIFLPFYKHKGGSINYIPAETVKRCGLDIKFTELLNTVRERTEISNILAICKTIELLVSISKIFDKVKPDENDYSYDNPLIKKVISYINQNYTKDIDISNIASQFNIDKSYLSHLFKDCTKMSLWNYVIYKRICLFNILLKENGSVEETSRKAGFQNYSNFFRLYKKHMKITPMQFKKQLTEENVLQY